MPRKYKIKSSYGSRKFMLRTPSFSSAVNKVAYKADKALRLGKLVASLVNTEHKYNDTTGSINVNNTNPAFICLTKIAQGTDNTQRIGRSVKGTYVDIRAITKLSAPTSLCGIFRFLIIQDLKTNGIVPPAPELLTSNDTLGQRNIDFGTRFKVLYDKTTVLTKEGANFCRAHHIYIDLKKNSANHVEFDGVTNAIGDISAHPIYMVFFCDNPIGDDVNINYRARYRYIDN